MIDVNCRLFFWVLLASFGAMANPLVDYPVLMTNLSADKIYSVTPSKVIRFNFKTPAGVRYRKYGDLVPSCAILSDPPNGRVIELVSPEPGSDFPSCGSAVRDPVIFADDSSVYAIFEYSVEDTRKEFTRSFKLLEITSSGARSCENEALLDEFAKRYLGKLGIKRSFKLAISAEKCR